MSHKSSKDLLGRIFEFNSAGQYDVRSEFEKSGKGFTLSFKHKKTEPDSTPGPSNYSPTHFDLTASPKISFSMKYKERALEKSPSPTQVLILIFSMTHSIPNWYVKQKATLLERLKECLFMAIIRFQDLVPTFQPSIATRELRCR